MYNSPRQQFNKFVFGAGIPGTIFLIAVNVLTFFTAAIFQGSDPFLKLAITFSSWPHEFWTLVTWPLIGAGHPINILFACLWAYWVCGSLERSWGTRTFLVFFFASAALMAFSIWFGERFLLNISHGILLAHHAMAGLFFALAAPTIAWCTINKRETICLYLVIRIPAPYLALLTIVVVWYEVGAPLLGLFGLSSCAFAYWYAAHGRYLYHGYAPAVNPFGRTGGSPRNEPNLHLRHFDRETERDVPTAYTFAPLRRYRAWQERRKLERLWKRSMDNDPPEERDNRR